jgi:hypothetical protein
MSDHKFTVEEPDRVICFSVTSEEAKAAFEWLKAAHVALKNVKALGDQPPMIISELFGGFSAIAENRPYGGH